MTVIPLQVKNVGEFASAPISGSRVTVPEFTSVLRCATQQARQAGLGYAGNISPDDAWKLFLGGHAHLIDVRTIEERKFIGYVPNTLHLTWPVGPAVAETSGFIKELQKILPNNAVILFLCRSGKRSAAAATAATLAGFTQVFSVSGGVDGDLNHEQDESQLSGWRQRGLPWFRN